MDEKVESGMGRVKSRNARNTAIHRSIALITFIIVSILAYQLAEMSFTVILLNELSGD